MAIMMHIDWHDAAATFLKWSLRSSRALSIRVAKEYDLWEGNFIAYAPSEQEVQNFKLGGGGTTLEMRQAIANVCGEFLKADGHIVAFEHHLWDLSDVKPWMRGPLRVTEDSFVQLAFTKVTPSHLDELIKDWTYLPICNAFLFDAKSAAAVIAADTERSMLDIDSVVTGLRAILSVAYDGEGFIVWWRSGDSRGG